MNEYPPGAPAWFELATTDQEGAKQFYTQLFGWSIQDNPMGPGETYTIFKLDGSDVSAAYKLPPELLQQGVGPHWNVYFATPDVDQSAAKVTELGGSIVQPPFDVMTHGRMAICTDPGGAMFSLWQANEHVGARVAGQDNAVCWSELATWDSEKARAFYTGLFGWQTKGAASMAAYLEFSAGGHPWGGLLPMDEMWKGIPSHWGIYFMVADCAAATSKAKDLGATVRFGPHHAPGVGVLSSIVDPQGAAFSVITLEQPR